MLILHIAWDWANSSTIPSSLRLLMHFASLRTKYMTCVNGRVRCGPGTAMNEMKVSQSRIQLALRSGHGSGKTGVWLDTRERLLATWRTNLPQDRNTSGNTRSPRKIVDQGQRHHLMNGRRSQHIMTPGNHIVLLLRMELSCFLHTLNRCLEEVVPA